MTDAGLLSAAALLLLLVVAARRGDLLAAIDAAPTPVQLDDGSEEQGQGGPAQDAAALLAVFDISPFMQPAATDTTDTQAANVAAFLMMIRTAEGTAGPDGYRTMFGYRLFTSWADHPRQPAQFTDAQGRRLWTSAAGAYQFMAVSPIPGGGATRVNTWDRVRNTLGLSDFSPASQDAAAVELIREAGALDDVKAGRVDAAVSKVRGVWASLPGAGYGQPERRLSDLIAAYVGAGGALA